MNLGEAPRTELSNSEKPIRINLIVTEKNKKDINLLV